MKCLGYVKDDTGKPCFHYLKSGLCAHPIFFRCIEYIHKFEPILSYSSIQNVICWRKFYLSYIKGYEAIEKPLPIRLGKLCSDVLDKLHSSELNLEKVNVLTLTNWGNKDEDDNYPYQIEALVAVLSAYVAKEKHSSKGQTQAEFRITEPDIPQVHGFIDLLQYEDKIGWEFKYTQKPESYTKFTLSDQLSTYFLAHKRVQRFTVRTILNPIGTIRLGKKETIPNFRERVYNDVLSRPKHYFEDRSYWRNEFDLDAYREKLRTISREIVEMIDRGGGQEDVFYQRISPYTCFLQGAMGPAGPCEYLSICSNSNVISEALYKRKERERKENSNGTIL